MYCNACGKTLAEDGRYCSHCGGVVGTAWDAGREDVVDVGEATECAQTAKTARAIKPKMAVCLATAEALRPTPEASPGGRRYRMVSKALQAPRRSKDQV